MERPDVIPELDRWYCYEYLVKANTPDQLDGRITFWLDGELKADFPHLRLRDVASLTQDGKLVSAKWPVTDDAEQNRASLKALAAKLKPEEVKQIVFSHTGVLPGYAPLRDFAAN